MKFTKFLLIIAAMTMFINVVIAQSSDKGASIISQENFYDVPMPSWMQEDSNKNPSHKSNTATVMPAKLI
jgi:hypothetical protein